MQHQAQSGALKDAHIDDACGTVFAQTGELSNPCPSLLLLYFLVCTTGSCYHARAKIIIPGSKQVSVVFFRESSHTNYNIIHNSRGLLPQVNPPTPRKGVTTTEYVYSIRFFRRTSPDPFCAGSFHPLDSEARALRSTLIVELFQVFAGFAGLLGAFPLCLAAEDLYNKNEYHSLLSGSVCRVRDSLDFLDVSALGFRHRRTAEGMRALT